MKISTSANLFYKQVTELLLEANEQFVLFSSFSIIPEALLKTIKDIANKRGLQVTMVVTQLARVKSFQVPIETVVAGMFTCLKLKAVSILYGSLVANEKHGLFFIEQELADAGSPDLLWCFDRHYVANDDTFNDLAYMNEILATSELLLEIGPGRHETIF